MKSQLDAAKDNELDKNDFEVLPNILKESIDSDLVNISDKSSVLCPYCSERSEKITTVSEEERYIKEL